MENLNQTKIYAIIITAILILGGPAGYFFTTQDLTLEIQEKSKTIEKALNTLKKAKSSIEKKDEIIKTQSGIILTCNEDLKKKDEEILSIKNELENAYAGISDDIISTESENLEKKVVKNNKLKNGTGEILEENLVKQNCPVCEKCEKNIVVKKSSGNLFDEKIELETMDLAYNKGLGESGLPYIVGPSKTLLEMYNGEDEVLSAKVGYYCGDDYLKDKYYGKSEKAIVRSYERAYCKDEKYENCSPEIKAKIDVLKDENNILGSHVIRILTKYNKDYSEVKQEMFAVYNDFGVRICSWVRNTSNSGKQTYIQVR